MNTQEVAGRFGVSRAAVLKWCRKNNVKRKLGVNGVMEYVFSEADCKRFAGRAGRGWKKGIPRKAE
jgi:predicted site-specific integrase-resolvase